MMGRRTMMRRGINSKEGGLELGGARRGTEEADVEVENVARGGRGERKKVVGRGGAAVRRRRGVGRRGAVLGLRRLLLPLPPLHTFPILSLPPPLRGREPRNPRFPPRPPLLLTCFALPSLRLVPNNLLV